MFSCPGGNVYASDGETLYHLSPSGYAALGSPPFVAHPCDAIGRCAPGPVVTSADAGVVRKFLKRPRAKFV